MEFKQLECFIKVVDKKSFSKASEALFISQPAVTSNIQKLENWLKLKLVNRNGKEISLTEAGVVLYSYANELINLREEALSELNAHSNFENGSLSINASTIPAQYIVPKMIYDFKNEYKSLNCELSMGDSKQVVNDVLLGKINIGFVGSEYPNKELKYIDFFDDEIVLITSNDVLLQGDEVSLDMIQNFDLIIREDGSGTRELLENELRRNRKGLSFFNSVSENDNSQSIKTMVSLGYGVAFASRLDIKNELKLGLLKEYRVSELNLKRSLKMVHAKYRHFSPVETSFKNFVLRWVDEANGSGKI